MGKSITIPHIKRVHIVREVGVVISGKLRYVPLLIACTVETARFLREVGGWFS